MATGHAAFTGPYMAKDSIYEARVRNLMVAGALLFRKLILIWSNPMDHSWFSNM